MLSDDTPLGDARAWLRKRVAHGEQCPCCTQFAKVYRRKLHATMVRTLIAMYRRAGVDWLYLPDVPQKSRDCTGMAWWGLIEEEIEVRRDDGGRAGWWRVTELGERFLRCETHVLSHAFVYDGRCLGLVGEPVSVHDCLGERFDYSELMADDAPGIVAFERAGRE